MLTMLPRNIHAIVSSIFLTGLVLLVVGQIQTKNADFANTSASPCDVVECKIPPQKFNCRERKKRSPKVEERLGRLKDCCPVYHCDDGVDEFLYIGLHNKTDTNSKLCTKTSCPHDNTDGSCAVETNPDSAVVEFAKNEISCCPVWKCYNTDADSTVISTRFSVLDGTLSSVTASSECTDIKCPDNPKLQGAVCSKEKNESVKKIGVPVEKLKTCCPVWGCKYPNESIYNLIDIQGNGFRYKEIQRNQEIKSKDKDVAIVVDMETTEDKSNHMDKDIDVVIDMDMTENIPTTTIKPKNIQKPKKPNKPQKGKALRTAQVPNAEQ